LDRRLRVVNRARSDHDGEPSVALVQHCVNRLSGVRDRPGHRLVARQLPDQLLRRDQRVKSANAQIVGVGRHRFSFCSRGPRIPDGQTKKPPGSLAAFSECLERILSPIATLPPPAASENRNTKSNSGSRSSLGIEPYADASAKSPRSGLHGAPPPPGASRRLRAAGEAPLPPQLRAADQQGDAAPG